MVTDNVFEHSSYCFVQVTTWSSASQVSRYATELWKFFCYEIENKKNISTLNDWSRFKNFWIFTILLNNYRAWTVSVQHTFSLSRCNAHMNSERKNFIMKQMVLLSDPELRNLLRTSDAIVVLVVCECLYNVVIGHMKIRNNNLEQYENMFKTFHRKTVSVENNRAILKNRFWFVSAKFSLP